ncbi:MAG: hypothetical protein WEB93_01580, partial [Sphingomonadales bacterium]
MNRRIRFWSSLSAVALIGTGALSACDNPSTDSTDDTNLTEETAPASDPHAGMDMGGAGGGEGEGEGAANTDLATDDVAYLTRLGLMRGHLLVGVELFQAGALDHARTHMKHPEDELYATMEPALESRGAEGFGGKLSRLATAMEEDPEPDTIEAAYADVLAAIEAAEARLVEPAGNNPATLLLVAANLVRTAGEEYAIGVKDDGTMVNAHEYQDAYGFVQTARRILSTISRDDGDPDLTAALDRTTEQLDLLDPAWPSIAPAPEKVDFDDSVIHGAAAR